MSNSFGWMPIQPEVTSSDGEIGGHCQLLAAAQSEYRAVIPNPHPYVPAGAFSRPAPDPCKQRKFAPGKLVQRQRPWLPARHGNRPTRSPVSLIRVHYFLCFFLCFFRIGQVAARQHSEIELIMRARSPKQEEVTKVCTFVSI
jgi:hypothetical protein